MSLLRPGLLAALALLGTAIAAAPGETRFHQYTAKFKNPKDPAPPTLVSYLGGSGAEWLCGGGFIPDGRIIVAGMTPGPAFDLGEVAITVLGDDGQAPEVDPQTFFGKDRKGRLEVQIDGTHTAGAPFLVTLNAAGDIAGCVRLPWGTGSCSSALVGPDGGVYIAGMAGANIAALQPQDLDTGIAEDDAVNTLYLARLTPALDRVVWCRTFADPKFAPFLRFDRQGNIRVQAAHLNVLSLDGEHVAYVPLHVVKNWCRGINPVDNSYALGYDRNTGTGREPWRKPYLEIHNADGSERYLYYAWDSHYVGIPSLRLVSDSSIREVFYDDNGIMYAIGWSDGGNSVLTRQPYDIRNRHGYEGLGFSTWGANVLSAAYIIKLDPESGEVRGATNYLAYLSSKNKPSSLSVKQIDFTTTDDIVVTGGSAFGFIQTGDSGFEGDYVGGRFLTIMPSSLDDLRFAGVMPAAARVHLAEKNRLWGISAAVVAGRHRVLAVCGAIDDPEQWSRNPVQAGFGGGGLDGLVCAFDLGPATSSASDKEGQ